MVASIGVDAIELEKACNRGQGILMRCGVAALAAVAGVLASRPCASFWKVRSSGRALD
jgi:hypothetical protein